MALEYTLLEITGIDMPDGAIVGLTMELAPIQQQGIHRRDINGNLVDLSAPQFQKYRATISGSWNEAPDLTGIWRGQQVTVRCIPGLGVTGDSDDSDSDGTLEMTMMVTDWQTSRDEWEAQTSWTLQLEQV